MSKQRKAHVYVRDVNTREIAHTVDVDLPISERQRERLLMGMLRNMSERYFVDDSELDQPC